MTVTVHFMALLPLTFAYILHLPDFRAFTTPLFETLAMDLLLLLHFTFLQVPLTFNLLLFTFPYYKGYGFMI